MATDPTSSWEPGAQDTDTSRPRCVTCGNHVTRQFARVFGDNGDVVHACPECSTYREMKTSDFIPEERR